MKPIHSINKILKAQYSDFEKTAKAMAARVAEFYPVGTRLRVIHAARQNGPDIVATVEVIAAPTWYRRPEMLRCKYYFGKKVRDFAFTDILVVCGLPKDREDEL